ncbi:helix-turn-helix domain-containing protein [Romboutsia hominis]|uniref:helix-turn-helix domain-containing protein n=1 Tax=Romboutsia hominis TaxID=1507512 RepID=UPI001F064DF3|nr:helix-turn-helix transcriptional regulator [Romboutsia hominis]MCH1959916.1 helix-turn-helix domain-containing protein [Romboutsia hominis]MCH1969661.1 helix-turn-helix domain-containing protein [Romboutsia hominis]
MDNLGKKLKEARKRKNITQEELAKRIGISKHAIAKYEQGQREPNLKILTSIIDELEMDFWEAAPPYEEGIKFGDEVYEKAMKKLDGMFKEKDIKYLGKEEMLKKVLCENRDLGVNRRLISMCHKEYCKRFGVKNNGVISFDSYTYFDDFKREFYDDLVRALLFTVELKMKEAEDRIKKEK